MKAIRPASTPPVEIGKNVHPENVHPENVHQWIRTVPCSELQRRGRLVFRAGTRQIALFHTSDGVLACNNRCPHEGYPLSQGNLGNDCVLTCNWHNWKFDLGSGENLYGGDRLRTYPVDIRNQHIWLDISDPPIGQRQREIMVNLRQAFDDNDYTWMARELGRLRLLGTDPLDAVRAAIRWSYRRMEFGWTHAFAATADWLQLYCSADGDAESQLMCLLESVAHMADDVLGQRTYPFTKNCEPFDEDALVAAIEEESEARSIALIRGALRAGLGFDAVEPALSRAALAHYSDFGHSLIYITKAGRLIESLGPSVTEPVLLSLIRSLVYAAREDEIPEFHHYRQSLARWKEGSCRQPPTVASWKHLGVNKALAQTVRYSHTAPTRLFKTLLGANACNLLAFDSGQQQKYYIPVSENVGWLDFSHGITFAEAVWQQCNKYPALWPQALLKMACFCGRNAGFTDKRAALKRWSAPQADAFFDHALASIMDHSQDEFIVSAHLLKTTLAAKRLVAAKLPAHVNALVCASVNRFLNSTVRRKQVRRTVYQAMHFVARDA